MPHDYAAEIIPIEPDAVSTAEGIALYNIMYIVIGLFLFCNS